MLTDDQLSPLPVFRSVAQTEHQVDYVAAKAGFTTRLQSEWLREHKVRCLTYLNPRLPMELTVQIESGGVLENAPVWVARAFLTRTDTGQMSVTKSRCRPAYFADDLRRLVTRVAPRGLNQPLPHSSSQASAQ